MGPEAVFINNTVFMLLMEELKGFFSPLLARNHLFHRLHLSSLNLAANELGLCFQGYGALL